MRKGRAWDRPRRQRTSTRRSRTSRSDFSRSGRFFRARGERSQGRRFSSRSRRRGALRDRRPSGSTGNRAVCARRWPSVSTALRTSRPGGNTRRRRPRTSRSSWECSQAIRPCTRSRRSHMCPTGSCTAEVQPTRICRSAGPGRRSSGDRRRFRGSTHPTKRTPSGRHCTRRRSCTRRPLARAESETSRHRFQNTRLRPDPLCASATSGSGLRECSFLLDSHSPESMRRRRIHRHYLHRRRAQSCCCRESSRPWCCSPRKRDRWPPQNQQSSKKVQRFA